MNKAIQRRKISILAPYKIKNDSVYFFLQKRSKDAKRAPGVFGFFGGGEKKGETIEKTLIREIKEELDIEIKDFSFFNRYKRSDALIDLFIVRVEDDFEKKISILERDYRKWFDKENFTDEKEINKEDIPILKELYKKFE